MPIISIDIPAEQATRVAEALCRAAGLPVSQANAKAALIAHIKATVANVELSEAEKVARSAIVAPVEVTPT